MFINVIRSEQSLLSMTPVMCNDIAITVYFIPITTSYFPEIHQSPKKTNLFII